MKDKKTENDKFQLTLPINRRTFKYAVAFLAVVAVIYTIVAAPQKIGDFISAAISILSPFLIGFCLAYVVNLLLRPIERFWTWCFRKLKNQKFVTKIKRLVCLTLSFIIVLGAIFAIVFMIIPAFRDTVVSFVNKVPMYAKTLEGWYYNVSDFLSHYNFELPEISLDTVKLTEIAKNIISNYGDSVLDTTVNITASIVATLVDIVLGIVFAIYLLAQKEKLGKQCKKALYAIFNAQRAEKMLGFTSLTNNVFTKFVTGQLTEACIIGALCFFGMLIFGMPYAGIISVLIGFTALIPMFGAFIGTAIGAFLILLENPVKAFWFIVFIVILQQLEGNLIYPKVVGKSVGLPGIWVLTAVTIGGGLFGIAGMLFSVPVCSVLYVVFKNFVNRRIQTQKGEEIKSDEN
ncbi:MAG: AI-2E family transporter [Clostridia bacterium]|nr:AI-2E family transporter [Clostridia bacterium]